MYEAYRWTDDGHTIIPDAVTNDTRSGSFAYDADSNGMRRLDDVVKPSEAIVRCKMYSRKCPEGITMLCKINK